ncbi:dihydrofolate synthase/folylpolyglutamate synthase [Friedmanniella endophytica]|uniref:Dihydrofolate synthase/folylpolyglutamate synthase n=1 Tax=Microlunatus kandeliicorticis TaxID=1759536 RepID=A0A7W3P7J4_9ACTN|nr:folylpolyglutamate synthase/dihydrofolate synthase family protein [Microlunatus kandeliicorticis]MBA8796017.1 dihydrofolate synthase/folylpolyglutamate synthase [Microlunatus kandeliicorticis]
MSELSGSPSPSSSASPADDAAHAELVAALTARWPEHRVARGLGRIQALCELLGDPQHSYPVIAITGTNGKGSTGAMIESLLRASGLRTGRFSSPHLMDVTERIEIDGAPISREDFARTWDDIEPYVRMVDERAIDGVSMTFFEIVTGMAFAAFADAPVDVAIMEVGMGGTWDATNVADAAVAVITPIDLDHTHLLGDTVAEIAAEKAGIIKPGANAVLAGQDPEAATVLLQRCADVGALVHREGLEFGVLDRRVAVGGQMLRLNAAEGPVDEVFLPLFGAHQAANAAQALAAAEAFLGMKAINPDLVREGFAQVRVPGRLEIVRRSPPVLLDAAHNPHGATAAAAAIEESFAFSPLVGVIAAMRDKDAEGMLRIWEPLLNQVVITRVASTERGTPAEELGELAEGIFGAGRVEVVPRLDDAIERAVTIAENDAAESPGVLITGSVVAVGEARTLLVGAGEDRRPVEEDEQPDRAELADFAEVRAVDGVDGPDAFGARSFDGYDDTVDGPDDEGYDEGYEDEDDEDELDDEDDDGEKDLSYGPEYGEQFDEDELTEDDRRLLDEIGARDYTDSDGTARDDHGPDHGPDRGRDAGPDHGRGGSV